MYSALKIIRLANNLTRDELANFLGVQKDIVWNVENLKRNVEEELVLKYAGIFNIAKSDILELIELEKYAGRLSLFFAYLKLDQEAGNLDKSIIEKEFYPLQVLRLASGKDTQSIVESTQRGITHFYSIERKQTLSLRQLSLVAKCYDIGLPFLVKFMEYSKDKSFKQVLKFCVDNFKSKRYIPVKYVCDKECDTAYILRATTGLNIKEFSALLGVSHSNVCRFESGEVRITLNVFSKYSKVIGVSLDAILKIITYERMGTPLTELKQILELIIKKERADEEYSKSS